MAASKHSNRRPAATAACPVCLTIAGSDSGGGAGVQADLKVFASLGVMGTSAITCLTAQNPDKVSGILPVKPGFVGLQLDAIFGGFKVAAAKTGMLYSAEIIRTVVASLKEHRVRKLVVDPVMVSTSGARLLKAEAVDAMTASLFPAATVITPNLQEAEVLLGCPIGSPAELEAAAICLGRKYGTACVVKGGHLAISQGAGVVHDVLFDGKKVFRYMKKRVRIRSTHGTGCTFSAAIAAYLGLGHTLPDAVRLAGVYIGRALEFHMTSGRHSLLAWRFSKR